MTMCCSTCLALEFGSDDSLRALVVYQAHQLNRLTGGRYEPPSDEELVCAAPRVGPPTSELAPDAEAEVLFILAALMEHEDIYRKPARVAAPRLLERLNQAGLSIAKESA